MNEEQVIKKAEEINIDDDNIDPPFVIVVQGSKESGKTTLIKSLVQHFTR
jgi:polynucleotide 5'-kinase involved in rRNA processing